MKFLKTPSGLIISALVIIGAVALISYNWNTIKGWFSSNDARATSACYKCCTTDGISCPGCDCKTNSPKV